MTRIFSAPPLSHKIVPRRVIHLIDGLGHGGAERLLTPILSGLRDTGFDASVVTFQEKDGNPESERLQDHGVPVTLMPITKVRRFDQIGAAWRRLRAEDPSLIHAHLQYAIILAGSLNRWAHIPAVATLHTDGFDSGSLGGALRMRLMKHSLNEWVCRTIALSPASLTSARTKGLSKARLTVLPNGIDLARFGPRSEKHKSREAIRSSLGIGKAETLALCVAVLRAEKGVDRLLTALSKSGPDTHSLRAVIVGEGEERRQLERQAQRLGINERVQFLGYRDDIAELMRAADLFVLPTLADALPTVIIEAMASGLPIIASAVGGIPHMVEDGIEGVLVPPDAPAALHAALRDLSHCVERRLAYGQAARQRAEREFSLDVQIQRLSLLYEELIQKRDQNR